MTGEAENSSHKTGCESLPVDSLVQSANQAVSTDFEYFADSEQRRHGYGAARFDLLPVACGEAEGDHVLLRVSMGFPQLFHPLAESTKELGVIGHASLCNGTRSRNTTSRLAVRLGTVVPALYVEGAGNTLR
jgi:hypothetical protein